MLGVSSRPRGLETVSADSWAEYSGLSSIDEFPHVKTWVHELLKRPGFEEGRNAPQPHRYLELNKLSDDELNEKGRAAGGWIQEGMRRDAEA